MSATGAGPLVLSVFPGADIFGLAFEHEGFCVVQGPDVIFGRDVRNFHVPPGRFDGVIGGPPCAPFSRLRHLVAHNGYATQPNLIPEFERVIAEAQPAWFVMENVPDAPVPAVSGYIVRDRLVRDVAVGGATLRLRRFSFGTRDGRQLDVPGVALHTSDPEPTVCASGGARPVPVTIGGSGRVKRTYTERHVATRKGASAMGYKTAAYLAEAVRAQGLPEDFLRDAPFTVAGKIRVVGNGVPMALGRAVAKAVRAALEAQI